MEEEIGAVRVFWGPILVCLPNQAEEFGPESVSIGERWPALGRGVTISHTLKAQSTHRHWRKGQVPFGGTAFGHPQERCTFPDIPAT